MLLSAQESRFRGVAIKRLRRGSEEVEDELETVGVELCRDTYQGINSITSVTRLGIA